MRQNRLPLLGIILIVVVLLSLGGYYLYNRTLPVATSSLSASGTIETTQVSIAPELSGKVAEVLVKEGDAVKAGDVLLRLDDTLLKAQRAVAAASLDGAKTGQATANAAVVSAQAQYDLTLNAALNDDKTNRTASWNQTQPTDFNQPSWYFNKAEQTASLQNALAAAQTALDAAHENLKFVEEKATSSTFLASETRLSDARSAFQIAQTVLDRTNTTTDGQDLKDEAQNNLDDAKSELTDAQKAYDDALTTDGAKDVLQARAKLLVAQERYDVTQDQLRALQTGVQALKVVAAQATLDQVKAAAAQAQSAVSQAQANLALIEAQIGKLTVSAPADGVILTRNVEPGEVVNPGSVVLSLGQLDNLTITVYVSENLYGQLKLGQAADVTVDSFVGKVFKATIIQIADQGEFTPRNVQTTDGRKTTVYAIKLQVENPDGDLKPGMPADVTFK
ncbi:MAG: efflux RND transporter periplasmic adaptor subunit [Anaerolineales bacterium]